MGCNRFRVRVRVSLTRTPTLTLTLGTRKIESQSANSKPASHTRSGAIDCRISFVSLKADSFNQNKTLLSYPLTPVSALFWQDCQQKKKKKKRISNSRESRIPIQCEITFLSYLCTLAKSLKFVSSTKQSYEYCHLAIFLLPSYLRMVLYKKKSKKGDTYYFYTVQPSTIAGCLVVFASTGGAPTNRYFLNSILDMLGLCMADTCHNGGSCRDSSMSGSVSYWWCDCPYDKTGSLCEIEMSGTY